MKTSLKQKDLVIHIHDVRDLFVAPPYDPLSDYEPARNGEAALTRAIRLGESGQCDFTRLILHLPRIKAATIKPGDVSKMLHHYLEGQLEENKLNLSAFRYNVVRIFRNAFLFLAVCMAIVTIVGNESIMPNMPNLVRSVLTEGFTVIGWVVLWRPVELILNELEPMSKKNKIYHSLLRAKVKIEPD